jgi:hypothetical protein
MPVGPTARMAVPPVDALEFVVAAVYQSRRSL